jgi:hypothetical protein
LVSPPSGGDIAFELERSGTAGEQMTQGDDHRSQRDVSGLLRLTDQLRLTAQLGLTDPRLEVRPQEPHADEAERLERSRQALVARVIEAQRTLAAMQASLVETLASLLDTHPDESGPTLRVVSDAPADAG